MMTKRDEIQKIIEKSRRAIQSAEKDVDLGSYDFASSRAYCDPNALLLVRQKIR